jgi:hypothetical protein
MKKIVALKKKLVKSSAIAALLIGACSGLMFFLASFNTEKITAVQQTESQMRQARADLATIEDNINIYERSYSAYLTIYEALKAGKYDLDAARGSKILELLGRKHRLSNMNLTMSSSEPFNTQTYVGFTPVYRNITLNFSAMTDTHVYAFLQNIEKYFSGYIHFTKIILQSERGIDDTTIPEVRKGVSTKLVRATVSFIWVGIEEKTQVTDTTGTS